HVDDESLEPLRVGLELIDDRISDRLVLVSPKARRHQDDACVAGVRGHSVMSEPEEVDNVPGDDRPAFARGVPELGTVLELTVADLVGARRVYVVLPKKEGDARRQVLIEVDPHRVVMKRTSPGYCFSIASGVSAAFASI